MKFHRIALFGLFASIPGGVVAKEAHCNTICWTSFSRRCTSFDNLECTFKEHGYALHDSVDEGGPVLIPDDHDYEVTWTGADPDYPIRIAWHFLTDQKNSSVAALLPGVQWDISKLIT